MIDDTPVRELDGLERKVLDAFRAVSTDDVANVPFHAIRVPGESTTTVSNTLARLVSLKYINTVRSYGPGPRLRELAAAEAPQTEDAAAGEPAA